VSFATVIGGYVVAVAAIAAAAVGLALGKLDSAAFTAIVSAFGGAGIGTAVHAQGVTAGVAAGNGKTP
jgi:hypothetical protein